MCFCRRFSKGFLGHLRVFLFGFLCFWRLIQSFLKVFWRFFAASRFARGFIRYGMTVLRIFPLFRLSNLRKKLWSTVFWLWTHTLGPTGYLHWFWKRFDYSCKKAARYFVKLVAFWGFSMRVKESYVFPLFKSGDKRKISNYRGIFILSAFWKVSLWRDHSDYSSIDLWRSAWFCWLSFYGV
jgi:hypothetical protein